jgi:hypothetical protein
MHPLLGSELRVSRASEHLAALKAHFQDRANLHHEHAGTEFDAEAQEISVYEKTPMPIERLAQASVFIGEVLYNLRGALDYLVYALALVSARGHVSGTQFPIEDTMEGFEKRAKQYLRHVPKPAVMRIMQLQPCWNPPCEWTRKLRDLSNPDKHRHLTALGSRALPELRGPPRLEGDTLGVDMRFIVEVFFADTGEDVVDTLEVLHGEVGSLIEEFKPIFKPLEGIEVDDPS